MKVALLSDCYPPRLGGIETQVRDLGRQLLAAGHEVHVYTATVGSDGRRGRVDEIDDGVHVHRQTVWTPFGVPVNPLAPKALRGELSGFDVAHLHLGVVSPFAYDLTGVALDLGLPTVLTWHCVLDDASRVAYGAAGPIARWAARGARLTAVSSMAAARVAAVAGGAEVGVLPNGIDPQRWRPSTAGDGRNASDEVHLVSAIRLAPRKRVPALIRMLRAVRERVPASIPLRASIFGDGPAMPLARRLIGDDRWIDLAGRVPRDRLAREYAAADLYLSPARLEAFGIAALEARTAGLPVVALASSGTADFVGDGIEGLLAADDDGLITATTRLVTDDVLRQRITQHNRDRIPEQSWPQVVRMVEREYAAAQGGSGGGGG